MLIRTQTNRPAERKAVILLVVIALLTLFAIIALSFLLYANAEANASKLFREGEANDIGLAGTSAEKMLNFFLKQFIYDVPDDNTGVYSALRGHSVGRSIYGANYDPTKATVIPNTLAFNGTGRLHTNGTSAPFMNPFSQLPTPFSVDDYQLINYTYYPGETYVVNGTNLPFLRDPERINPFPTPPPPGQTPWRNNPAQPAGQYTGGANAPYTYPDLNNMFLAAVKADGTVLMPSFFRPYTGFGPMDPVVNSWNWTQNVDQVSGNPTPWLKYMVLRPRPADNPGFPLPEDGGGDVKNLPSWSPGTLIPGTSPPQYWNNDSFWMDLGAPIITNKNGKKIKPLFAPLIIDLDGRINLNTSGNVRLNAAGPNPPNPPGHASNQGWGPWEVDISHVLNNNPAGAARPEWTNTFLGDASGFYSGRYGTQGYPGSLFNGQATGDGVTPHIYGQVDYDGTQEANTTNPYSISLPIQLPPAGSFSSFPTYNTPATVGGYGNNAQIGMPPPPPPAWPNYAGNTSEGYAHPLLYQYFQPSQNGNSQNFAFPPSNMEALLRYNDVNSTGATSDLMRLLPNNMGGTSQHPLSPNSASFIRHMVTTHSFDVDAPGISSWAIPPGSLANYNLTAPALAPSGSSTNFPSLAPPTRTPGQPTNGDFNGLDWRSVSAQLGKINLNRKLTPYTGPTGNIQQADLDRQQFAADIFIRLVAVTGAYDLFNPTPPAITAPTGQAQFDALRWLAQLSANIVDYIDNDDVITTFNWAKPHNPGAGSINLAYQNYPAQIQNAINNFQTAISTTAPGINADPIGQGWVFGTELPRVVINEAYAEYTSNPAETMAGTPPAGPYNVKVDVWAELHNPFSTDLPGSDPDNGNAILNNPNPINPLTGMGTGTATSVYQLVLANTSAPINLRAAGNVLGYVPKVGDTLYSTPTNVIYTMMNNTNPGDGGAGTECITPFASGTVDLPASNGAGPPTAPPLPGYYVVGPPGNPPGSWATQGFSQPPNQFSTNATMEYTLPMQGGGTAYNVPAPTILLQRLMNPYAATNIPGSLGFNPAIAPNFYITVDYLQGGIYSTPPDTTGVAAWAAQDSTSSPRISYGRVQPYTGAKGAQIQQQAGGNTFYSVNNPSPPLSTPATPFNWPAHLDRQLVSPMELLNVSAFKPHEFTQQFNSQAYAGQMQIPPPAPPPPPGVTPSYYGHRAPWFDEDLGGSGSSHFLYRVFEFLETGNRMTGMAPGGRIPGKVNLLTIYDQEIFQALAAAQPAGSTTNPNYFDQIVVQNIFNAFMTLRSPGLALPSGGNPTPDGLIHPPVNSGVPLAPGQLPDNPFLGLAAGLSGVGGPPDPQYPGGLSILNTLMRPGPTPPQGLFQVTSYGTGPGTPVTHPYLQDQLFAKIFNNVTTRSNVFAIWLTVGFFEVTDATTRPVQLGAEIGKNENRQLRHRMFAIIDRSSLATEANNPSVISPPPVFVAGTTYEQVSTLSPPPGGPPAPLVPLPAPITGAVTPTTPVISIPGASIASGNATGSPATTLTGMYDGIPWGIQAFTPSSTGTPILGTNLLIDMGSNQELVNVLGIDQPGSTTGSIPAPRVYLNGTMSPGMANSLMAHTGPLAVTPVNTITAWTPITAGSGPATVSVSAVSGSLEGVQWSIQAGTKVMVDVGSTKELALVQQVIPPAGPAQPYSLVLQAVNPTGMWANAHPAPINPSPNAYTISYPIPTLGNPGPQATLNIRQIPWVVRYLSIIN